MRWGGYLKSALIIVFGLTGPRVQGQLKQRSAPLKLPISPVAIAYKGIPLTKALSEIGARTRDGYISFGIEVALKNREEPAINLNLNAGSTLGDALDQTLGQLPNYSYEVVSAHLINVYPRPAKDDPDDLLNVRVTSFDVVNEQPDLLLSAPDFFIPGLRTALKPKTGLPQPSGYIGPGLRGTGPTVTLHLRNVTVREILNSISEATENFPTPYTPLGWVYAFQAPARSAGPMHIWKFNVSVPSNWKQQEMPPVLQLPIFPVPIVREKIPVTKALSEVGAQVRQGYALFGIEVLVDHGKEPAVELNLPPGTTLGEALQQIFHQLKNYQFEVVSEHLIDIYPLGAKECPKNVLNVRVPRFDLMNGHADSILSRPQDFIPELRAQLVPRKLGGPQPSGQAGEEFGGVGPAISVHLKNVTVRQILNAVSEATEEFPPELSPLGWVCSFRPDPTLPGGGAYSWIFHWSAPRDWKQQSGNAGKGVSH